LASNECSEEIYSTANFFKPSDEEFIQPDIINQEYVSVKVMNAKGERKFASNKNLTNEMIYLKIMEAREDLQPETPNEINLYMQYYYTRKNTVGKTHPRYNTIYTNGKFFNGNDHGQVAGNLAHEWTHKMGFDHQSVKESDSVPYAIGKNNC
jgi:hypothetical protein